MGLLKKTYIFLIAFFIGYPTLYLIQFWHIKNVVDHKDESIVANIAQMLDHSSDQSPDDLFQNMFDTYRQTESISYYVIRDGKGQLIYPSSENALIKESSYDPNSLSQSRRNIRIQGKDYIVFFGKDDVSFATLLMQLLSDQKEILFVFCLGIILLIHQVASYFLHFDVKMIIQWFKGRSGTGESEILSAEAHRLKNYIHGVEERREHAEQLALEYKNNSYSGLTWAHEQMQAGTRSVEIVAARCDINGYTILKQKISAELLQYIVQTFFNRGGEYLSRYGAYKENASGDEISFFVPKNEHNDAELRAVHIVRGLFEIFQDLSSEFKLPELQLTVKAALDIGTVEIEKLGGNSETEGQPLINTARFLTAVDNKDISTLVTQSSQVSKYQPYIESHNEAQVKVKNYDEPYLVTYIQSIHGYAPAYTQDLKYFRTDRDIALILKAMTAAVLEKKEYVFHSLRNHLTTLPVSRLSYQVVAQYKVLLKTGLESGNALLLSGITLLAKTLFTRDSVDEEIVTTLSHCLQFPNKRVVSNTREALHKLRPELIDLHKYIGNDDNRIAADSLIDLIKKDGLTDEHTAQITRWLTAKDKAFQLSALYVAYQVYSYWSETRPEYIGLNHNFKSIDSVIKKMDHSDVALKKWLNIYEDTQTQRKSA
ncbi:hypothetical protein [Bdellovibrio sp. HCB337]|uniref:hypothetical protein n=1 Tax=Bdellovibrio sp. HCB337 TaxID=3394358 RepID=UPI0039A73285